MKIQLEVKALDNSMKEVKRLSNMHDIPCVMEQIKEIKITLKIPGDKQRRF